MGRLEFQKDEPHGHRDHAKILRHFHATLLDDERGLDALRLAKPRTRWTFEREAFRQPNRHAFERPLGRRLSFEKGEKVAAGQLVDFSHKCVKSTLERSTFSVICLERQGVGKFVQLDNAQPHLLFRCFLSSKSAIVRNGHTLQQLSLGG